MMSAAARAALCLLLLAAAPAQASKVLGTLRHGGGKHGSLLRPIEFKHTLRVCNAFPVSTPLDVLRGQDKLTQSGPMAYKECRDFTPQLMEGDKLEFKVGDSAAGTFSVGELPANNAVLLLVIHRHDTLSTAVSFESHTFAAGIESPQIAVIDAYKGSERTRARIADAAPAAGRNASVRDEELLFDNAVAVSPGAYEVKLAAVDGKVKANTSLVALSHESYVVMRIGVEAKAPGQQSFPQELVVYPQSPPGALRGGARAATALGLAPLVVAVALLGCGLMEF